MKTLKTVFLDGYVRFQKKYFVKTKEYYPNGVLKSETQLLDKRRAGTWKFYYDNKQLQLEESYSNSKLILPGYEVIYTTPDNEKFKTYQEASNHISELARSVEDVDLDNIKLRDKSLNYTKGMREKSGIDRRRVALLLKRSRISRQNCKRNGLNWSNNKNTTTGRLKVELYSKVRF